jgi:hypothetical protein
MKNTIEQQAEQELAKLWSESIPIARPFVTRVIRLETIPEEERQSLVRDVTAIGDAIYQTTVSDYDRQADGLRLSKLLRYSDGTIRAVTQVVRNLGAGNRDHAGLGESATINSYLSEFNSLLQVQHREKAISA